MKLKTLLLTLLLSTSLIGTTYADWKDGLDALDKGDFKVAISEFESSANRGDTKAQVLLGIMYGKGTGTPKDDKQALQWFQKAADQGSSSGQTILGLWYADGRGAILKDLSKAKYWIKKAYENPDASANEVKRAKSKWESYELWKY